MSAINEASVATQTEIAAAKIEELIMNGSFELGAHINESSLSVQTGIGRAAIREACHRLAHDGLVELRPNQGAFVKTLTLLEVTQLFDIRAALGRLAGSQAAASIGVEALRRLRELIGEMDEVAAKRDSERYIGLNLAFHACLYEATGNPRLAELDRSLGKELRIYRRHGLAFGGGLAVSNQEHREILASIERGNCELAGMQLEKHIRGGKDRFLHAMSASGQLVLQPDALRTATPQTRKKERERS